MKCNFQGRSNSTSKYKACHVYPTHRCCLMMTLTIAWKKDRNVRKKTTEGTKKTMNCECCCFCPKQKKCKTWVQLKVNWQRQKNKQSIWHECERVKLSGIKLNLIGTETKLELQGWATLIYHFEDPGQGPLPVPSTPFLLVTLWWWRETRPGIRQAWGKH